MPSTLLGVPGSPARHVVSPTVERENVIVLTLGYPIKPWEPVPGEIKGRWNIVIISVQV